MSWEALNLAATDRRSGSAVVAAQAANAFVEISSTLTDDAVVDAARTLVAGQPLMAACLQLVDSVLRGLDEKGLPGAHEAAQRFERRLASEKEGLTEALVGKLPREGTVLTVSASSTVIDGLIRSPHLRVICAVSDPGGEGRGAAAALEHAGADTLVIPDGAIAQHATRSDVVVFGADVIGPSGLINKTGTLAAALGARASGRQCWAVAGTSKLVDEQIWPRLTPITEHLAVEGVPAFEEVPASLITTFVTENGATGPRTIRRAARGATLHDRIGEWLP